MASLATAKTAHVVRRVLARTSSSLAVTAAMAHATAVDHVMVDVLATARLLKTVARAWAMQLSVHNAKLWSTRKWR